MSNIFARLQPQVQMFGQNIILHNNIKQTPVFDYPTSNFRNLAQARQHLEYLLREIINLSQLRRHPAVLQEDPPLLELLRAQARIRAELEAWSRALMASIDDLRVHTQTKAAFSYKFLSLYHTMAVIMVETCLETVRESNFDILISNFDTLLAQAVDIEKALSQTVIDSAVPAHNSFGSIVDIGWIPPLYYTALKCRNPRIRVHVVKLLNSTLHRGGIWDSRLAEAIAQEVIKIEERDFYKGILANDEFLIQKRSGPEDLLLPRLPESYLVKDVEVILFDNSKDKVAFNFKQRGNDGNWQTVSAELDL